MSLRDTINQKPWLGWTLAGAFLAVGVGYFAWSRTAASDPYNPERLQEIVTIKFTDDNSTMQIPRGRLEKMLAERPELNENEGITNPKTQKPTGFLYNEADWKEMVKRINADKAAGMKGAEPNPAAPK